MTEPMTLSVRVPAPVPEVRRALTDAEALCTWLAEHAEVDLPERFAFWGRYTPQGRKPNQRLVHVDERSLRFGWLLDDVETMVEIALEAESERSTLLALTQTHVATWEEATTAEDNVFSILSTFWAQALTNLVDYVLGREMTPMCDFTTPRMHGEVLIDAPVQAVYDSLVEPGQFRKWFGANMDIELWVGGRFSMGGFELDPAGAKILELEPGRKMTIDWNAMVSTWELADAGGKTRLTFVQSGFDEDEPPYAGWLGWLSGVTELRRYHELADWRPIWVEYGIPGTPDGMLSG